MLGSFVFLIFHCVIYPSFGQSISKLCLFNCRNCTNWLSHRIHIITISFTYACCGYRNSGRRELSSGKLSAGKLRARYLSATGIWAREFWAPHIPIKEKWAPSFSPIRAPKKSHLKKKNCFMKKKMSLENFFLLHEKNFSLHEEKMFCFLKKFFASCHLKNFF